MNELSDQAFDALISRAMDELPQEYIRGLQNVAIVMADAPDEHQLQHAGVRDGYLLLGLYEGVPAIHRSGNESGIVPDKITLFKDALVAVTHDEASLFEQVKRTLWHEIAHYYGLEHSHIDALENRRQ